MGFLYLGYINVRANKVWSDSDYGLLSSQFQSDKIARSGRSIRLPFANVR